MLTAGQYAAGWLSFFTALRQPVAAAVTQAQELLKAWGATVPAPPPSLPASSPSYRGSRVGHAERLELGARIRSLRLARGWSQPDLARELGIHFATVSYWESGRSVPRPAMLQALQQLGLAASALAAEGRLC